MKLGQQLLQNLSIHLPNHTASHPEWPQSGKSQHWEQHISYCMYCLSLHRHIHWSG